MTIKLVTTIKRFTCLTTDLPSLTATEGSIADCDDGNEYKMVSGAWTMQVPPGSDVTLAASQPLYAPSKAGDAMTLTASYDNAKTAAQPGDAMTLTSDYDAAKTAAQPGDTMVVTNADAKTSEVHKQTCSTSDGTDAIGTILKALDDVAPATVIAAKSDLPPAPDNTRIAEIDTNVGAEDDTPTNEDLSNITETSAHAKLSRALMFVKGIQDWLTTFFSWLSNILTPLLMSASNQPKYYSVISDTEEEHADAEQTTQSTDYIQVISLPAGICQRDLSNGFRVKFDLKVDDTSGMAYAQVYLNGDPIGVVATDATGSYQAFSQDFMGLSAQGNSLTIWAKVNDASRTAYVRNFQICYDVYDLVSQALIEFPDGVYFNQNSPFSGRGIGIGLAQTPVNNIDDMLAILAARNLARVYATSAIPALVDLPDLEFIGIGTIAGEPYTFTNNNYSYNNTKFVNMQLFPWAGDVLPLVTALDCWIYPGIAGTGFLGGTFTRCNWYSGFIFIADDSTTVLSDCTFEGAQIVTTVAPISVLLDRAMGDFTLKGLTSGTVEFNMLGGSVMIDSSCIGTGIVKIWGNCKLINNAGAGTTVIDDRNPECKATMFEVLNYAPGVKDSGQLAIDQAVSLAKDATYFYVGRSMANQIQVLKVDFATKAIVGTWEAGIPGVGGIVSSLTLMGGKLYAGVICTDTIARLFKIDPTTMTTVTPNGTWVGALGSEGVIAQANDGTYIYISLALPATAQILQIDPTTMTVNATFADITKGICLSLYFGGTYVYGGTGDSPAYVIQIDPATMLVVLVWTGATGQNIVSAITGDGTYIYAGCNVSPAIVQQIDPTTMLSTLLTWTAASGSGLYNLAYDGTNLYASDNSNATVDQILIATMTTVATWVGTTVTAEVTCYGLLYDGTAYVYALADDAPPVLEKIDPTTMLSADSMIFNNITATSFPATADFSVVMTSFDKPTGSGAKYYVQDLFGTRVQVAGIVLGGGATALTLQISVDDPTGLVAANILETIPMTADTVTPLNINLATYPTIFPWLNDGLPHQYDFFFKVDAGNAYFTTLEYWYSTGATGNPWPAPSTFHLDYIGRVCWPNNGPQVSSVEGNPGGFYLCQMQGIINSWPADNPMMDVLCFNPFLVQDGSSATDLVYYTQIYVLMVGGAH